MSMKMPLPALPRFLMLKSPGPLKFRLFTVRSAPSLSVSKVVSVLVLTVCPLP